ncbi:MAG: FxsA family protein [Sporolactobacillus sp.]
MLFLSGYACAELAVLFLAIRFIGIGYTLLLLLISALCGCMMVWHQGWAILQEIRMDLNANRIPDDTLLHRLCLMFGGILLILPGLINDAAGLVLCSPIFRRWIIGHLKNWLKNRPVRGNFTFTFFK